jgi:hypothetical protein
MSCTPYAHADVQEAKIFLHISRMACVFNSSGIKSVDVCLLPSGNFLHSYLFMTIEIVDVPIKHGDFP